MTKGPGYLNSGAASPGEQQVLASAGDIPIDYPLDPTGPVPPDLRWVVLTNASPYTLLIKQGAVLGWLAAFTDDSFFLPMSNTQVPLTYSAIVPSGNVQPGFNSQLFSVWYEGDPGGVYPANVGAGEVALAANATLIDTFLNNAAIPFQQTVDVRSFLGLALYVNDLSVTFTNFIHVEILWQTALGVFVGGEDFVLGPGGFLTVRRPVGGESAVISVDGGTTGPIVWQVTVTGLVHATPGWGGALGGTVGEGVFLDGTVNVGAGANTVLATSDWCYGGPTTLNLSTGLATFLWTVSAMDSAGAFHTIDNWNNVDFLGATRAVFQIIVPASFIRVQGQNNTGAAGNMRATMVADVYR